jgi:hypothetical protein
MAGRTTGTIHFFIGFFGCGFCMSMYYQVCSTFTLSGGRPQLVNLSLHSTLEYFPYLVGSHTSLLSHSRYFHSIPEANHYIGYLYSRYPNSAPQRGTPRPVLDALQLLLF